MSVTEVTLGWKRPSCLHLGPGWCTWSAVRVVELLSPAFSSPHPGPGLAGASSIPASWSLLWVTDAALSSASLGLSRAGQTPQRTCPSQLGCQKDTIDAVAFPQGTFAYLRMLQGQDQGLAGSVLACRGPLPVCPHTVERVSSRPLF